MEPMSHWIMLSSVARIYIYKPCQLISMYSALSWPYIACHKILCDAKSSLHYSPIVQTTCGHHTASWLACGTHHSPPCNVKLRTSGAVPLLMFVPSWHVQQRVLLSCIVASAETDTWIPFLSPAQVPIEGLLQFRRWILNNSGSECL